jgi:transcriptional regulator with GAF, ATPase, and Fis domain
MSDPITRVVQRGAQPVRLVRGCVVDVLGGADRGLRREVEALELTIGTHASNQVVLSDDTVSRHHLQVTAHPEGYEVADLGSSNGTFIGELRLGKAKVAGPVVLQLGQTTLRIAPGVGEHEVPASSARAFGPLLGRSLVMRELFAQLEEVARSDCAVLLQGETGVGKERVAEAIHQASAQTAGPFVVVDCAAMAVGLMESELFGHVRGAFTGAAEDRSGLIEKADGGTLFLDEIGELPLVLQAKLLGVLERQKVTPLGSAKARQVHFRAIAATHRDLLRMTNEGQFRADLYYRLAVVRLRVPPLRERMEDIPLLIEKYLGELRTRERRDVPKELSAVALAQLYAQSWPGNVRELFNAIEQALLQLPVAQSESSTQSLAPFFTTRARALDDFGHSYFSSLVQRSSNFSEVARQAGLDRRYLARLFERYNIAWPRGRQPR